MSRFTRRDALVMRGVMVAFGLTLAGIAFDPAPLDGQSLFVADGEQYRYTRTERPRIAELVIPERCVVRSVTTHDWKYIAASAP